MSSPNKLNPIPHPPKKPVVGNMLSLDSTAPVQDLVRKTKELGPIFWLDMMGAPLVIVSGHDPRPAEDKRLALRVRNQIAQELDCTPSDVRVVPPRWLLKSSSGKLARGANRAKYLQLLKPHPQPAAV